MAHSLGAPMVWYFLQRQPQQWKDRYVGAFIPLSGVWGGTVKSLKVYAAGMAEGKGVMVSCGVMRWVSYS